MRRRCCVSIETGSIEHYMLFELLLVAYFLVLIVWWTIINIHVHISMFLINREISGSNSTMSLCLMLKKPN